ncbi:phosphoenolpyruvate--protein phosphotransferase [Blautia glucerasea]|uniref:phosphoenolpyruvate--protein phosphotransferase n=1 Tax=Blautia glucerasea TaxID=536633 RepID=UPI00156EAD32|nr:phosphoenolpyruvate--protein phosphotransferase [Blautia glucerasea]NSL04575.1 phosphoenolpyruvate--protein phosphotransferase [Blautia glucerasea]
MEIYKGASAFAGIAIGKIQFYRKGEYQLRQHQADDIKTEQRNFDVARRHVMQTLKEEYDSAGISEAIEHQVLEQAELLGSGSFLRAVQSMISGEKVTAAYAVQTTRDELNGTFGNLKDPSIKERIHNVSRVSDLLLEILGKEEKKINLGEEPVILAADALSPAELMEMDKEKLLGIVTRKGSATSHTAILAKSMDIPCVTGVGIPASEEEWEDTVAIIDGYTGTLYLEPDREVRREYEIRRKADLVEREALLKLKDEKDITLDGKEVGIYANIGSLDDLNSALYYGARGIGLLRSEFQYLGRESYPGEEELFQAYKKTAQTMGDRLVVIRTADLGADKQAAYLEIPQETNPLMGNRGIRFCLDRKNLFKTQIRAIYRASWYGNLGMMYPMISEEEEMDAIEELIREVKAELSSEGILFKNIRTGIMMETPAAVMIGEELARRVDFLGIGTNDLTQYTLAMDRQNPLLQKKYNDHHPAVVRMIKMIIDAGHKENCKVCLCGELAADTRLTETFLRMGVDALSVVPACILPVRKALRAARVKNEDE